MNNFAAGSGIGQRGQRLIGTKTTKDVFSRYDTSAQAQRIIGDGIDAIAKAIAVSMATINPSHFAFDGAVARNNKWYIEKAFEKACSMVFPEQYANVKLLFSELGDDAVLLGTQYVTHDLVNAHSSYPV